MSESQPCEWVEEQDALPLAGGGQHLAVGADVENVKKRVFTEIDSYKSFHRNITELLNNAVQPELYVENPSR